MCVMKVRSDPAPYRWRRRRSPRADSDCCCVSTADRLALNAGRPQPHRPRGVARSGSAAPAVWVSPNDRSRVVRREENAVAKDHGSSVKNDKQYEGLREKGMSQERAAKIANTPSASSKGGKNSHSGARARAARAAGPAAAATASRSRRPAARVARRATESERRWLGRWPSTHRAVITPVYAAVRRSGRRAASLTCISTSPPAVPIGRGFGPTSAGFPAVAKPHTGCDAQRSRIRRSRSNSGR